MRWTTLVEPRELAEHLRDPALAIVDCRYNLDQEEWGAQEFSKSHIPGAV